MTDTATSPLAHPHHSPHSRRHTSTRSSRPTTTPAARAPSHQPGSVGQNMPPLLSPRTPHQPTLSNAKAPSPNYFGFAQNTEASYLNDSPQHAKANWSPPSSTVRSTAAASPSVIPVDQNPEFAAFRRQSEGKAFSLGGLSGGFSMNMPSTASIAPVRPTQHRRTSSKKGSEARDIPAQRESHRKSLDPSTSEFGRSPKRVLSPGSMVLPEETRRGSPASFATSEPSDQGRKSTSDEQPRFALPLEKAKVPPKAESLPATSTFEDVTLFLPPQHVVTILESRTDTVLLLDLRVQTQYAKSHIAGALNLCIPTTLLKRPSFNVQKLAEAFKDEDQRRKFERWRSSNYIIVYDATSAQLKDATICVNTIKKFKSEGFTGTLCIIKGGFNDFFRRFPAYVEEAIDDASDSSRGVEGDGPDGIPVMGGCPMPSTDKPANPFFGNIRQNMDLIGGVGQIPLARPAKITEPVQQELPPWLRQAADESDEGRTVAAKFEKIERREKKRMEGALSSKVAWSNESGNNTPLRQQSFHQSGPSSPLVHLAGLEKGSKNRYNNIWPFEHTRVKLQHLPSSACDYFNANHIHTTGSRKRYISTQAPIPATFNDFWNVIWQQDIRVIVMLTAEKEGGQVKAHNYWEGKRFGPMVVSAIGEKRVSIDLDRIRRHGRKQQEARPSAPTKRISIGPQIALASASENISVGGGNNYFGSSASTNSSPETSSKKSEEPYVTVRRFTLAHEKYPFAPLREITQLHYSQWPDFGAPAHPRDVLGLVEQCEAVTRATGSISNAESLTANMDRPVLVHCSAGCGRTGTFCTVDSVVDLMKKQRARRAETSSQSRASKKARAATPMEIDAGFFASSPPSQSTTVAEDEDAWLDDPNLDLVEKVVEDFRHQRLSMVQSLRQFVLCYESVMEWAVGEAERGR